ncbi:MAG: hypothetical protein LAP21_09410 [Acidobacteriia bacterium]|nr:hypothetical protein [Terriglobia bacterium]
MNLSGFTPHEFKTWSSLVEQDGPTALPMGVAAVARNVTFHRSSVRTRDGMQTQFQTPLADQPISGLVSLVNQQPGVTTQIPMIFDMAGRLFVESPVASGTLVQVTPSALVTLPANAQMQAAAAYNRGYLAFSDLKSSPLAGAAVYDLQSGALDPYSMLPVGDRWRATNAYKAGEVITPTTGTAGNGHTYRCTASGNSGATEPTWPLTDGGTVSDGTCTWKETTPHAGMVIDSIPNTFFTTSRVAGAGSYAAGRDVYIAVTINNGVGESTLSATTKAITNTTANDQVQVTVGAAFPSWLSGLSTPFTPTTINVYAADVATGAAPPGGSTYHKVGSPASLGGVVNVSTTGAGAAPPSSNGALITPTNQGNICTGTRYMIVLFKNRNGYITGMTEASVQAISVPTPGGQQLWVGNIPTGPSPQTAARICCFTVAGGASVGDYFYVASNDTVSGVQMTSTIINDNTTTTATFNFTDIYLTASTKVTSFFRKVQAPPCVDIYFSESLNRMVLSGATGYAGSHLVSLQADPESFYGDTGVVQPGVLDGQATICWREFMGNAYSLKERSGYLVTASPTDPSTWVATKRWDGVGPVGPRAVDVANKFMCFVHRSGCYVFFGDQPQRISTDIPKTWRSINWDFQHLIWVDIDDECKEIRIGVPLGDETAPSHVLKCNYEEAEGFDPPIHQITFGDNMGAGIATAFSRKWSVDDIGAHVCGRVERKIPSAATGGHSSASGADALTRQSQIMFGSSSPDGAVNAVIPGVFNDNGAGIDCVYETVSIADLMRPQQLGGLSVNAVGYGEIFPSVIIGEGKDPSGKNEIKLLSMPLDVVKFPKAVGARGTGERLRLRFTNGKQKDFWFDLKYADFRTRAVAQSR